MFSSLVLVERFHIFECLVVAEAASVGNNVRSTRDCCMETILGILKPWYTFKLLQPRSVERSVVLNVLLVLLPLIVRADKLTATALDAMAMRSCVLV